MQVKLSFTAKAAGACVMVALAGWAGLRAQQVALPFEPQHQSGQTVTGAFEGWFSNPDGTYSILVGYYNRNQAQVLDIPIGPNNKIEPGGPDRGQPTHFIVGRQWGVFTINVPKDFGNKRLIWTITANGKATQIPLDIEAPWEVSPFIEATGNTPPYIGFNDKGPFINGPKGQTNTLSATVGTPLALPVWVADDAKLAQGVGGNAAAIAAALAAAGDDGGGPPPAAVAGADGAGRGRGGRAGRGGGRGGVETGGVSITWGLMRGPGGVTFEKEKPALEKAEFAAPKGSTVTLKGDTTATFSAPGEYLLKVSANDSSGEGGRGFQCCWSNAYVKVSVKGK